MTVEAGDRVKMVGLMPNDPCPIPIGMEGTVRGVTDVCGVFRQIDVKWDDPERSLSLLSTDPFVVVGRVEPEE